MNISTAFVPLGSTTWEPTEMAAEVIRRMLVDQKASLPVDGMQRFEVVSRNHSAVGYIANFERSRTNKVLPDDASLRWGGVFGRINSIVDVDYVVYVDDGYLTGLECVTFGGELMPETIREFVISDRPNR